MVVNWDGKMPPLQAPVPVTTLTGYLGSGKTTLLNHLLSQPGIGRAAVIVNEFGEIGIDAQLIVGVEEDVLEINNGCICCTVRADLVSTIGDLLRRSRSVDRIIIETTGLADPAPIIQSFILDETLRSATELDGIVTVVDARHNALWLATGEEDERRGLENTAREQIAFADLVLVNKTDLVDGPALAACEGDIRRINPIAGIQRMQQGAVQWGDVLDRRSFDLRNILRIEPDILADVAHAHADDIASVVVRPSGPVDPERFFAWLNRFVQENGRDILRLKGIVALSGERRRYVVHGVHMTLDGRHGRPWGTGETRSGEMVFIGRRLDAEDLRSCIESCVADHAWT